jgi:hypothetical protein
VRLFVPCRLLCDCGAIIGSGGEAVDQVSKDSSPVTCPAGVVNLVLGGAGQCLVFHPSEASFLDQAPAVLAKVGRIIISARSKKLRACQKARLRLLSIHNMWRIS